MYQVAAEGRITESSTLSSGQADDTPIGRQRFRESGPSADYNFPRRTRAIGNSIHGAMKWCIWEMEVAIGLSVAAHAVTQAKPQQV